MKKITTILPLLLWCLYSTNASCQDEQMTTKDFNLSASINAIHSINKSLNTFRDLVEIILPTGIEISQGQNTTNKPICIEPSKLAGLDTSELTWRRLNMANPNKALLIEGTLLKLEMERAQQEYDNMRLRRNKYTLQEIEQAKSKSTQAQQAFRDFMEKHNWYE